MVSGPLLASTLLVVTMIPGKQHYLVFHTMMMRCVYRMSRGTVKYLQAYGPSCLPTCLLASLPARLPACITTYLPTFLPAFLPIVLPTFLPTFLLATYLH